jgi:hypothetical protein
MVRGYAAVVGVVLIVIGLLGFVDNPIVGPSNAFLPTGAAHNVLHVVTGLVALAVAVGLGGAAQANMLVGFGVLYEIVFIVLLISPTLFSLFDRQVNVADDVLNASVALVSIAVASMTREASAVSY